MQASRPVSRDRFGKSGSSVAACAVVGLVFGLAAVAHAQSPDARSMLDRMARAIRTLDYQGSLVYQHEGRVDTLRVFHAGGAVERERLISLNGPRREVIRNGTTVTCIQPDGSATVYSSSKGQGLLPLVPDASSRSLGEYYEIKTVSSDRVAGFEADIVDVLPRDGYRYGYRLWLDRDTRLPLRSTVVDSAGRALEQFMFVSLEIGKLPSDTDLIPRQSQLLASKAADTNETELRSRPQWSVLKAPPGFEFVSARRPLQGTRGTEHLVYSDGLANVSIYVEPGQRAVAASTTLARRGTLNVFSRIAGEWQITVLGNVPAATVAAIGRSLQRSGPAISAPR